MEIVTDNNDIWRSFRNKVVDYPDRGNDNCIEIEENSFWFKHRNNVILEVIRRFPFQNNFVDIGGGNGFQALFLSNYFKDKDIFLVEPGYEGCLNAKKRGLKEVFNMKFQDFPINKYNIGGVGLFDVVEHIEDDIRFLKEIKEICKPGTIIYVTVPAHNFLWSDVDDFGLHHRRYNRIMIKDLAIKNDLSILYNDYFFSYLTPLTFALRALPYRFGIKRTKEQILKDEVKQHNAKMISRLFEKLNTWELKKIKTHIIGIGASCIAVFKV